MTERLRGIGDMTGLGSCSEVINRMILLEQTEKANEGGEITPEGDCSDGVLSLSPGLVSPASP